ncbi:hypothetical protein MASR1M107_30690 [Ignavibacteriales bacterium]
MSTLPGPKTIESPEGSLEKKVYSIAEELGEYLPVPNDRNRLGYMLYKYATKEGDAPEVIVKSGKFKLEGISKENLASLLTEKLKKLEL